MKIYEGLITNNEIKLINSLSRKKERLVHRLFIVEGNKNIQEVINSNYTVNQIFGADELFSTHDNFKLISQKQLERISQYKTSSEALALVNLPDNPNLDLNSPSIILENISDPGNLGTIIRTADWFGIKQVICSPQSVDCYNPKVVSSTKGSLFRIKVAYTDLTEFVTRSSIPSVATSLSGTDLTKETDLSDHHLVFGSESHGISSELEHSCSKSVKIPSINSNAESLNLAISVGILCGFIHLNHQ